MKPKIQLSHLSFVVSMLAFVVAVGTPVYTTYKHNQAVESAAVEKAPNPYETARFDFEPSAANTGFVVWRNADAALDYSSNPGMGVLCWQGESGKKGLALLWYGSPKNGKTVMMPLVVGFDEITCEGSPVVFKYKDVTLPNKDVSKYAAKRFAELLPPSGPSVFIPSDGTSGVTDEKP